MATWTASFSSFLDNFSQSSSVYRRRGEFDKAILIHQNLLSRPNLDKSIKNQSLYELSKDFFSAGLYDKSEKILLNLKSDKSYYESCNEYLLLTYELSKDWDKAITFSKDLKSEIIRNKSREILIAQYYCEKAMDYLKDEQPNKTITVLKKAVDVNKSCTRAYKLLFELNIDSNPELAFDYLHSLVKIDPNFIHYNQISITGSFSSNQDDLKEAFRMISKKKIKFDLMDIKNLSFSNFPKEINNLKNKKYIKCIFKPW